MRWQQFFDLLRGALWLAGLGVALSVWIVVCFTVGLAWRLLLAPTALARRARESWAASRRPTR